MQSQRRSSQKHSTGGANEPNGPQQEDKLPPCPHTSEKINAPSSSSLALTDICLQKHSSEKPSFLQPYIINSHLLGPSGFSPMTRLKMALWFIEESYNHFLPREVCSKAIALLDWFWMRGGIVPIGNLQELGIACLGVAWKTNESGVGIIPVDERNFNKTRIVALERTLLTTLSYNINGPTVLSIALQILPLWDKFVENDPEGCKLLPRFLSGLRDDECQNMALVARMDEMLAVMDICSSILGFLDFDPEDVAFNTLFLYVKECVRRPLAPRPLSNDELVQWFHRFSLSLPEEGLTPMGDLYLSSKLQKCLQVVMRALGREREAEAALESDFMWNFLFDFNLKEAKDMSLEDYYQRLKGRKIVRKARKQMNMFEVVLNLQVYKPYYSRVARNLLKDLQSYFN